MSRRLTQITDWPEREAQLKFETVPPVRVALLDGDPATHATFRSHLAASQPGWQLDTHTHGTAAWRTLQATPPQLIMLAQTLPDGCGLEWLRRCQRQWPELPVVMLTARGCAKTLWEALLAGAHGYWVKGGDTTDLVKHLREVLDGKMVLCDKAQRLLPQAIAGLRQQAVSQWGLSRREDEILRCLCKHKTDKEIATGLGISDETVHVHLHNAFKKLGVHDRKAAVAKFQEVFRREWGKQTQLGENI